MNPHRPHKIQRSTGQIARSWCCAAAAKQHCTENFGHVHQGYDPWSAGGGEWGGWCWCAMGAADARYARKRRTWEEMTRHFDKVYREMLVRTSIGMRHSDTAGLI
jgi:hypothetical protein